MQRVDLALVVHQRDAYCVDEISEACSRHTTIC